MTEHGHDHIGDPDELFDALLDETVRLAGRLAFALEGQRRAARFALVAQPVAVTFTRGATEAVRPRHRSGSLDPELLPFLVDAVVDTRARLRYGPGEDNPYLIALVLACFYVVESRRSGALRLPGGAPHVRLLEGEAATRDVLGQPAATTLRVIAPVADGDGPEQMVAVELVFAGGEAGGPT